MRTYFKFFWTLFFPVLTLMIIDIIGYFFDLPLIKNDWFVYLIIVTPLLGVFGHLFFNLGEIYSWLFIILASGSGFISEWFGLNFGLIFGGSYYYHDLIGPNFFDVPIFVIIYWCVFIYTSYGLIDYIWPAGIERSFSFLKTVGRSTAVSLAVVAIDLIMDPLLVSLGHWSWTSGGEYFGIPWENFSGWFAVSFLTIFIFELLNKKKNQKFFTNRDFIPASGYALIIFSFSLLALLQEIYFPVLIGFLFALPWIMAASLKAYFKPPAIV